MSIFHTTFKVKPEFIGQPDAHPMGCVIVDQEFIDELLETGIARTKLGKIFQSEEPIDPEAELFFMFTPDPNLMRELLLEDKAVASFADLTHTIKQIIQRNKPQTEA